MIDEKKIKLIVESAKECVKCAREKNCAICPACEDYELCQLVSSDGILILDEYYKKEIQKAYEQGMKKEREQTKMLEDLMAQARDFARGAAFHGEDRDEALEQIFMKLDPAIWDMKED